MRRLAPALALLVAACATRPVQTSPEPVTVSPTPPPQKRSNIIGLTAGEVVAHFGHPALQVREGAGLKLQFRSPRCVLDAYLYPEGAAGTARVTYIDTRLPSGAQADQAACISALENPS
jgi:hypothetical protein